MLQPHLSQHPSTSFPPISWNDLLGVWEVRSYADVLAILKDRRFTAARANINHQSPIFLPAMDSDPKKDQQEVIQALQQELPWIRQKMQEVILAVCNNKSEFNIVDFYEEIILPCCHQLAIVLADSTIKPEESRELLEDAKSVFLMNSKEDAV